jgi:hypothetical protein
MTVSELSKQTGISRRTIGRILDGELVEQENLWKLLEHTNDIGIALAYSMEYNPLVIPLLDGERISPDPENVRARLERDLSEFYGSVKTLDLIDGNKPDLSEIIKQGLQALSSFYELCAKLPANHIKKLRNEVVSNQFSLGYRG